jgi:hypothetical protein
MLMTLQRFLVPLLLALLAVACFALNQDIPRILSGVDQITQPNLFRFHNLLLWAAVISAFFAAVFSFFSNHNRLIYYSCSFLFFVLFLASIQAWKVDTYDMFAHLDSERSIFNITSTAFLALLGSSWVECRKPL